MVSKGNHRPRRALFTGIMLAAALLGSCGNNGGGGGGGAVFGFLEYAVSNNGAANVGTVDRLNAASASNASFLIGNNEGIDIEASSDLVQAGDRAGAAGPGSIRVFSNPRNRPNGDAFDPRRDREIGGPGTTLTGLTNPKGLAIAHAAGLILVANNNSSQILAFGSSAAGDVLPLGTTALAAPPWDLAYDEAADRLFVALTNGTVAVFDGWLAGNFGAAGATRTFFPVDGMGAVLSVNFHGIAYEAATDRLVVTDVGSAAVATDGQVFMFAAASTLTGGVTPLRSFAGPATMLGNPVDCILLAGTVLRVVEKANGLILDWFTPFSGPSGDVPPTRSFAAVSPESIVAHSTLSENLLDVTDLDSGGAFEGVQVLNNPGVGQAMDGQARRFSTDLAQELSSFDVNASLENVVFDANGDAFITFDDGTNANGGIVVINRLAKLRDGESFDPDADRVIGGPNSGLSSPKGIEIATGRGLLFVCENSVAAASIRVFGVNASGDVAPLYFTDLTAVGRPWDLDYDPVADRLFVALTNGQIAVFDTYDAQQGQMPPSRLIAPADALGSPVGVNLHGIVHDRTANVLIVSDVGLAGNATDGSIYVIAQAATASGNVTPVATIAGPSTLLGNPVDLAWDGTSLYVAEKANGRLLRFDGLSGGDRPPSASVLTAAPESVVLVPSFLSGIP